MYLLLLFPFPSTIQHPTSNIQHSAFSIRHPHCNACQTETGNEHLLSLTRSLLIPHLHRPRLGPCIGWCNLLHQNHPARQLMIWQVCWGYDLINYLLDSSGNWMHRRLKQTLCTLKNGSIGEIVNSSSWTLRTEPWPTPGRIYGSNLGTLDTLYPVYEVKINVQTLLMALANAFH